MREIRFALWDNELRRLHAFVFLGTPVDTIQGADGCLYIDGRLLFWFALLLSLDNRTAACFVVSGLGRGVVRIPEAAVSIRPK
jgi:hypothetical protein